MNRPKDIADNEIEMGPWYWAMNRRGDVIGTGKFAVLIGSDDVTFFINGTGYNPSCFTYLKHAGSPTLDFVTPVRNECEHGVIEGNWCASCNAAMKAARIENEDEPPEPDTCVECGEVATSYDDGTPFCNDHYRCKSLETAHLQRNDEAWMHAACLTIAETGQKWGDAVQPSLAMQAVYGLRKEYERLRELTHKLIEGRGAIVSSADCSPMELAFARKENRFVVDADGMGFVVRLKEWRENAEANASA